MVALVTLVSLSGCRIVREYEYRCRECGVLVVLDRYDADSEPCVEGCGGALARVYSFYLSEVPGAGGSPGKRAGGKRDG